MDEKNNVCGLKSNDKRRRVNEVPPGKEDDISLSMDACRLKDKTESTDDDTGEGSLPDCPVCLQACIYPVQLPCKHIFCFLCVKGVANRSRRCALCRQEIPADFFCHPTLIRKDELQHTLTFDNGYQWFYEGQNGWWQYDDRTSIELENFFKKGEKLFELLIAGFVYLIDLENMVQCRRNDRTKKRRVKRDLVDMPGKKGVAGLKIGNSTSESETDRPNAEGDETIPSTSNGRIQIMVPIPINRAERDGGYTNSLSPPTPYNTPLTPQTPAESPPNAGAASEQDLSIHLQRLRLTDGSNTSTSPQEYSSLDEAYGGADSSSQHTVSMETQRLEDVRSSLQEIETEIYNQIEDEILSGVQDEDQGIQV